MSKRLSISFSDDAYKALLEMEKRQYRSKSQTVNMAVLALYGSEHQTAPNGATILPKKVHHRESLDSEGSTD